MTGFARFLCVLCVSLGILAAEPQGEYIQIDKDTKLYVHQIGEGKDIILIHGGPGLGFSYMYDAYKPLAKDYRLTFFDQRGANNSKTTMDAENINLETFVDDIERVRLQYGMDKVNLIAHSFGGYILHRYVAKYPDNVESATFIATAPVSRELWDTLQENYDKAIEHDAAKLGEISDSDKFKEGDIVEHTKYYRALFANYMCDPNNSERLEFGFVPGAPTNALATQELLGGEIYAANNDFDNYTQLEDVSAPILVIHGECDIIPLESSSKLAASSKNGRLVQLKTGHFPGIEDPVLTIRTIRDFIN